MKPCFHVRGLLVALVSLSIASPGAAGDGFFGRLLEYYRNRPYPVDHFAPGYYGYNLDDQSRGYFGGGRYTEYYNYGRGGNPSNLANFPGPAPGPSWLYDNRNWIGTQPVRPFATPGVPRFQRTRVVPPGTALLSVEVPEQAVVWLEDQPMQQTGPVREYVSPKLEPGVSYTYTIRARWHDGSRNVEQVQQINVEAGQIRQVIFAGSPAGEGAQPRMLPPGLSD